MKIKEVFWCDYLVVFHYYLQIIDSLTSVGIFIALTGIQFNWFVFF